LCVNINRFDVEEADHFLKTCPLQFRVNRIIQFLLLKLSLYLHRWLFSWNRSTRCRLFSYDLEKSALLTNFLEIFKRFGNSTDTGWSALCQIN
jgi:hypothetical protein